MQRLRAVSSSSPLRSLIRGLAGYTSALPAAGFRGQDGLNLIHEHALTPLLEANLEPGTETVLACWTLASVGSPDHPGAPPDPPFWDTDGTVHVMGPEVPPMASHKRPSRQRAIPST